MVNAVMDTSSHAHKQNERTQCAERVPAMQQVLAALVLWLRTKWVYLREAQHLKEVAEQIVEESSDASSIFGANSQIASMLLQQQQQQQQQEQQLLLQRQQQRASAASSPAQQVTPQQGSPDVQRADEFAPWQRIDHPQ
jgi:hypothetical protein